MQVVALVKASLFIRRPPASLSFYGTVGEVPDDCADLCRQSWLQIDGISEWVGTSHGWSSERWSGLVRLDSPAIETRAKGKVRTLVEVTVGESVWCR